MPSLPCREISGLRWTRVLQGLRGGGELQLGRSSGVLPVGRTRAQCRTHVNLQRILAPGALRPLRPLNTMYAPWDHDPHPLRCVIVSCGEICGFLCGVCRQPCVVTVSSLSSVCRLCVVRRAHVVQVCCGQIHKQQSSGELLQLPKWNLLLRRVGRVLRVRDRSSAQRGAGCLGVRPVPCGQICRPP